MYRPKIGLKNFFNPIYLNTAELGCSLRGDKFYEAAFGDRQ
jgi:hypothetical protein